jgi:hypothetical protein
MSQINIDAEFVVAAAVLNEGVSGTDHVGRAKLFGPQPALR